MGKIGLTELILVFFVVGCFILLPILALIDIFRSKFEGNDNIMFVLVVIFVPIIGPILYFILGPVRISVITILKTIDLYGRTRIYFKILSVLNYNIELPQVSMCDS